MEKDLIVITHPGNPGIDTWKNIKAAIKIKLDEFGYDGNVLFLFEGMTATAIKSDGQVLIQELHNIKREIIEKLDEVRFQGIDIEDELRKARKGIED